MTSQCQMPSHLASFSPPSCAPVHGARDLHSHSAGADRDVRAGGSCDSHPNEAADGHRPGPILTRAVQACSGSPAERRAGDERNRVFAGHALPVRGTAGRDSGPCPGDQGAAKSGDVTLAVESNRPSFAPNDARAMLATSAHGSRGRGGDDVALLRDRAAAARRPHKPEVGGASPPPAILDPTTETQRTQRAHESWGSGSNPVHPLSGPRIGLSASVVNESRSHEAAITPGAVAHARRRVLPDAVAVLIRIGWMVVGAAAWAAMGIHITPGQ